MAIPQIEHEACGQTAYDQAILDKTVEVGVAAGNPRPQPRQCPYEPVEQFERPAGSLPVKPTPVPASAPVPVPKAKPAKKGSVKWLREKVRL